MPKDDEVKGLSREFDFEIIDETEMEHEGSKQDNVELEEHIRSDPIRTDQFVAQNEQNTSSALKSDRIPFTTDRMLLQKSTRTSDALTSDRITSRPIGFDPTRPDPTTLDRVNHSAPPNAEISTSRVKTKEPEAKIIIRLPFPNRHRTAKVEHQVDTLEANLNGEKLTRKQDENVSESSQEDEADNHSPVVDVLEADSYGKELTSGQSETVSELERTPEAIEVMTSELQTEVIEVNNLKLKLPLPDLNIYMLNDNEDCFIIKNIVSSEPHPSSLIVSNVCVHETPLEKGHFLCIQGQGKLKLTMQVVAKEGVRPERDGTRRGTKRCWDPGGSFDKVRLVPWARKRDFGNRFGGANGRGKQDDYDDPGDERVTMHSIQ